MEVLEFMECYSLHGGSERNESYPGVKKWVAMKRGRIERRKILTFVEWMLFITIIVGVAAGITIPLYTGHVEKAKVTEATSIMGAVITSQKVYFTRKAQYYTADNSVDPKAFEPYGINITDTKVFTYKTAPTPDDGFTVTATATDAYGAGGGSITYVYDPVRGGRWTSDGDPMPHDMYEPGPPSHSPRILII